MSKITITKESLKNASPRKLMDTLIEIEDAELEAIKVLENIEALKKGV